MRTDNRTTLKSGVLKPGRATEETKHEAEGEQQQARTAPHNSWSFGTMRRSLTFQKVGLYWKDVLHNYEILAKKRGLADFNLLMN